MACEHTHSAMLGGSLVATMRNVVDSICPGGEGFREKSTWWRYISIGVIVPLGMGPLLEILKVLGKDASVGEDLGDSGCDWHCRDRPWCRD